MKPTSAQFKRLKKDQVITSNTNVLCVETSKATTESYKKLVLEKERQKRILLNAYAM